MPSIAPFARLLHAGFVALIALTVLLGATNGASAQGRHSAAEIFEANELAEAVTVHMQDFWDDTFIRSDLPYETPYAVLYDRFNYGATGCGDVEDYGYSWYCLADDTVYVNIDQVQDLREEYGDLYAAVLGVGQPMSMSVLDRVGGLALDRRTGGADIYSQEAAACLTGVWTAELWYEDIITADDVLLAAEGLSEVGRTLDEAFIYGYDTEDPQSCLDVMLPS